MERTFKTRFNIGQEVYHITPESPKGIIIDILYYSESKEVRYAVVWNYNDESICKEIELTEDKTY